MLKHLYIYVVIAVMVMMGGNTLAQSLGVVGNVTLWPENVHRYVEVDEERVTRIVETLTVEEKVAQLIMGEIGFLKPEDLTRYRLGGILNGGGTFPNGNKHSKAKDWMAASEDYHQGSIAGTLTNGGAPVPVIWGTDAVHGHSNLHGATIFPHNIGLGATRNEELLKHIGSITGAQVAATGIFWNFAPTIAVPTNYSWGRTYEGLSSDPQLVGRLGAAYIEGIQGDGWSSGRLAGNKVLATAKHFLGDGGTYLGIDQGDTRADEETMRRVHGHSYIGALEAGAQTVMASYNSWNGEKMHQQHYFLTTVLKERMGFDGFVVGDWNGHGQVAGCTRGSCALAINAGVDMIMVPEDWRALYKNTVQQAHSGEISTERLNDAVRRIIRVKLRAGLFDGQRPRNRKDAGNQQAANKAYYVRIARQAVRESLVLLKNNNNVLPLKANKKILVVGSAAKDLDYQFGGWTLGWQGLGNKNSDFPQAQSLLDGIKQRVRRGGGTVEFSRWGTYKTKPDVAVVAFGEKPYAEFFGDRDNLLVDHGRGAHLGVMGRLSQSGIPIVAVFFTGRPLWVNNEINVADSFVTAWLPGTASGAAADVLFCASPAQCDFKGTLPFAWPNVPQNVLIQGDNVAFPQGYGLTYSDQHTQKPLPTYYNNNALDFSQVLLETVALGSYRIQLRSDAEQAFLKGKQLTIGDGAVAVSVGHAQSGSKNMHQLKFGGKTSAAWLLLADAEKNWAPMERKDGYLVVEAKATALSDEHPLYVALLCAYKKCHASIDISPYVTDKLKQWHQVGIPLSCFEKRGVDLRTVKGAALWTQGEWELDLGHVKVTKKFHNTDGWKIDRLACDE